MLLVDEFDMIVNQVSNSKNGFDEAFFGFLRGLAKDGFVTLVLTGGERMPSLMTEYGEFFNHARRWRITYLNRNDGSVERLLNNDYIRGHIELV